jgi:hypothetical protein
MKLTICAICAKAEGEVELTMPEAPAPLIEYAKCDG